MHLQFTNIKITIKTASSHKGIDNDDVSGLVEGGSRKGGGGKNIDFWEVISLSPVMMGGGWVSQRCDLILYLRPQKRLKPYVSPVLMV